MKLIKMIPDPVSQPEAFDPVYPKELMERDVGYMSIDNPWLGLCNLAQCVFLHGGQFGKNKVDGAKITFVTEIGSATFDSLDLASYWLMCMDEKQEEKREEKRDPYPDLFGTEDDKSEFHRAYLESAEDRERVFVDIDIGTADSIIETTSVMKGDLAGLLEHYRRFREQNYCGHDVGPIEDKFFVLYEDYQAFDTPVRDAVGREFYQEGHLICNNKYLENMDGPLPPQSKAIWDRRRIPYEEVVRRLSAMVVPPPKPGQKYFHGDFVSY